MMHRTHRSDGNQSEIVKALRAIGCTVTVTSGVGHGFPDLVAGRNGVTYLLEVKDDRQSPSKWALTAEEAIWFREWKGHAAIVYNVLDALAAVGATMM